EHPADHDPDAAPGGRLRPGRPRPADRKLHRHRAGLPDRGNRPPPHDRHSPLRPAGAARPAHLLAAVDAGQHRAVGAEPGRPHPGAAAGRPSGAGHLLYGGYLIVNIGVTISLRTRMTPLIASAAAAVNLGLNFWAIPHWGIVGAGLTTVLGYALLLWMGWANSQRSYPVPYEWMRVGKV